MESGGERKEKVSLLFLSAQKIHLYSWWERLRRGREGAHLIGRGDVLD